MSPMVRIYLNGQTYISVKTGHTMDANGNGDDTQDYAVLATFNPTRHPVVYHRAHNLGPSSRPFCYQRIL